MELYNYKATIIRVIDGDTVDLDVDLGFGVTRRERVRFSSVDAPEIRTKDLEVKERGFAAKAFVDGWVASHPDVFVNTIKDGDKYGRYLARIVSADGECLNDLLIQEGHAVTYTE